MKCLLSLKPISPVQTSMRMKSNLHKTYSEDTDLRHMKRRCSFGFVPFMFGSVCRFYVVLTLKMTDALNLRYSRFHMDTLVCFCYFNICILNSAVACLQA